MTEADLYKAIARLAKIIERQQREIDELKSGRKT